MFQDFELALNQQKFKPKFDFRQKKQRQIKKSEPQKKESKKRNKHKNIFKKSPTGKPFIKKVILASEINKAAGTWMCHTAKDFILEQETQPSWDGANATNDLTGPNEINCLDKNDITQFSLGQAETNHQSVLVSENKAENNWKSEKQNQFHFFRKFELNQNFNSLISFAEKMDIVFQSIAEIEKRKENKNKESGIAFEVLRLKYLDVEKRDCEFGLKMRKMLAIDASKYNLVKTSNFSSVCLEVRRKHNEDFLFTKDGLKESYRRYFKQQLYGTLFEFHERFLANLGYTFDYSKNRDWHIEFTLNDVYNHLNYEPQETPECIRMEESWRKKQSVLMELDESSKEKNACLRQRILNTILANEKSIPTSSLCERKDGYWRNLGFVGEIVLKTKMLFRLRKVSNIFLASVLHHFKSRAVFAGLTDESEVVGVLSFLAEKVPQWIRFLDNKNGIIVKLNSEMDVEEVMQAVQILQKNF